MGYQGAQGYFYFFRSPYIPFNLRRILGWEKGYSGMQEILSESA